MIINIIDKHNYSISVGAILNKFSFLHSELFKVIYFKFLPDKDFMFKFKDNVSKYERIERPFFHCVFLFHCNGGILA